MENRAHEFIKANGIVQRELAAKLGMTAIGLQQLLKTRQPKISTIERLAKEIGVPTWKLLLTNEELEEIIKDCDTRETDDTTMICPRCGAVLKVRLS